MTIFPDLRYRSILPGAIQDPPGGAEVLSLGGLDALPTKEEVPLRPDAGSLQRWIDLNA